MIIDFTEFSLGSILGIIMGQPAMESNQGVQVVWIWAQSQRAEDRGTSSVLGHMSTTWCKSWLKSGQGYMVERS